jgi:hypothetical protein
MNKEEKFAQIQKFAGAKNIPEMTTASVLMIINYLDELQKRGVIKYPFQIPPRGRRVTAICEEYDWKPTDDEIAEFVMTFVSDDELLEPMAYFITRMRDEREEFLAEVENIKKQEIDPDEES